MPGPACWPQDRPPSRRLGCLAGPLLGAQSPDPNVALCYIGYGIRPLCGLEPRWGRAGFGARPLCGLEPRLGGRAGFGVDLNYRSSMEASERRPALPAVKRVVFIILVLVSILFTALLTPVPYLVLGWFVDVGPGETSHKVHEIAFGALFVFPLVGLVAQLRSPHDKVSAMYQVVLPLTTTVLVLTVIAGEGDPIMLLFLVFPLLIVLFHPARPRLLRPALTPSPLLLGLAALAAVPLLIFAVDQLQVGAEAGRIAPQVFDSLPEDATDAEIDRALRRAASGEALEAIEHYYHWSTMGAFAIAIVVSSFIAAARPSGWRLTAWTTATVTILFGVASLVFPADASALGGLWSVLAILWGVALVAVSLQISTPASEAAPIRASSASEAG